jgi:hypothetical protein
MTSPDIDQPARYWFKYKTCCESAAAAPAPAAGAAPAAAAAAGAVAAAAVMCWRPSAVLP